MSLALQLDAFNFDESQGATEDPLLAGLLMMPLEAQIQEVSICLMRHHISKAVVSTNTIVEAFDKVYPRTANSITNKRALWRLLGINPNSGKYNDAVSILQNLTGSEASASAVVCQFMRRTCENQQLIDTVTKNILRVNTVLSDAALGAELSLDPSPGRTFLQMIVEYHLACGTAQLGSDTYAAPKSYEFDHCNNELEVNGMRIGAISTLPSVVAKLSDLDITNAQVLGKGAGGSVLRALHIPSGKHMAVKTIVLGDSVMGQVVSELSVVWGVNGGDAAPTNQSPFLIRCFGVFYSEGVLYIVMEVMDGSLKDLVRPEGLPEQLCKALAFQSLSGLSYMHSTLKQLHRDIKPHNILFRRSDGAVKLSDFGISSSKLETLNLNRKNTFCGTLRYMSPLTVESSDYGFEADLWSFGVTLIQLAVGDLPYKADSPYAILGLKNVPPRLPSDGRFSAEFQGFISDLVDPSGQPPPTQHLLKHPWFRGFTLADAQKIVASST